MVTLRPCLLSCREEKAALRKEGGGGVGGVEGGGVGADGEGGRGGS